VLPLSLAVVVVDFAGLGALVSGPRNTPLVQEEEAGWRQGVAIGLTPAGARAVLGVPVSELTGAVVPLDGLQGSRAANWPAGSPPNSAWAGAVWRQVSPGRSG
jgi:hypothetical protein